MKNPFASPVVRTLAALLACHGLLNSAAAQNFPDVIPLPDGFQPEGIAIGYGTTAYVGSLADGSIYQTDLRTGAGEILVQGPGSGVLAVGLSFDKRTGYLFVAGGLGGDGRIYDTASGQLIAQIALGSGFVNDVVVTKDAAFFTDSFAPQIYRVPLNSNGEPATSAQTLPLTGDFQFIPGAFNANGIVATPGDRSLIVVNGTAGELYNVDVQTGFATLINLGGASADSGDGLVISGRSLYVVQNFFNQIAEFTLSPDFTSATLARVIVDADFRIPTTADQFGAWLYAVNARFDVSPPGVPSDIEYEIVRVSGDD